MFQEYEVLLRCSPRLGEGRGGVGLLLDKATLFCVLQMKWLKVERYGDLYRLLEFHKLPYTGGKRKRSKDCQQDDSGFEIAGFESLESSEVCGEDASDLLLFGVGGEPPQDERPERFRQSVQRARARVKELALCNDWEYFVTLTLSETKQDRYSLSDWAKDFGVWIGNYNRKYGTKLRYIVIPEMHKNGAWHGHGLLGGVASESLCINEHGYLDMPYYRNRFGWINLSKIKDKNRVSNYIAKYITKAQGGENIEKGKHLFYTSRGLAGKEFECFVEVDASFEMDWSCEYCSIKWITAGELSGLERI